MSCWGGQRWRGGRERCLRRREGIALHCAVWSVGAFGHSDVLGAGCPARGRVRTRSETVRGAGVGEAEPHRLASRSRSQPRRVGRGERAAKLATIAKIHMPVSSMTRTPAHAPRDLPGFTPDDSFVFAIKPDIYKQSDQKWHDI